MQELPILPAITAAWVAVAAVAVLSMGAQLSINQALIRIPAPKVSVIMTIEVPLVAGFGVLYLGEPLNWNFIAGTLLICGSGTGLNLMPGKKRPV
jgi:drug/metabolite transporter (DMT)-like permease